MNKRGKERLLKHADNIENVRQSNFDLSVVTYGNVKKINKNVCTKYTCGAVACAIGYLPIFFPRIFKYEEIGFFKDIAVVNRKNKKADFEAVAAFFDISNDDAYYLFDPTSYPKDKRGPKSVARRMRDFANRHGKVNHDTKAYNGEYEE